MMIVGLYHSLNCVVRSTVISYLAPDLFVFKSIPHHRYNGVPVKPPGQVQIERQVRETGVVPPDDMYDGIVVSAVVDQLFSAILDL